MAKSTGAAQHDGDEVKKLHKSLASIGVDKDTAQKLVASKSRQRIVVPIYWKEGLESRSNALWLTKLPEFLRSFTKEFPDGEVRWDPDYESSDPAEDVAIRVRFNVQEDDQGNRFHPKPTLLEEEAYQRMLERSSFKGTKPVPAHLVAHGE
ncbi:MAG: hypothetical protein ABSF83_03650 [Nitrososphaerales archaeon]